MYRFLLTPRWLVAHVAVLLIVAVCVTAGLWQLRRHDDRRTFNALIAERSELPPASLERLLASGDPDDVVFRAARVNGTYDTDHEILLAGRTHEGRPGHHLLTPLVTDAGRAILVDRGWVPFEWDDPPVAQARPPDGEVTISGFVLLSDPAGRAPTQERRTTRVNVDAIAPGLPYDLYPVWLILGEQAPGQPGDHPAVTSLPEPEAGPHLPYAVQWFLFAAVAVVVYTVILRKEQRKLRDATSVTLSR